MMPISNFGIGWFFGLFCGLLVAYLFKRDEP